LLDWKRHRIDRQEDSSMPAQSLSFRNYPSKATHPNSTAAYRLAVDMGGGVWRGNFTGLENFSGVELLGKKLEERSGN
jgi:hypothetical protein